MEKLKSFKKSSNLTKFDDLSTINDSSRDWKIKVKVVRFWRGSTKQGQPFSNFNLLLIDKQETKIQAFVPAKCNDLLQDKLALGTTCSVTHFDVEKYKDNENFRTVSHEYKLIFGEDTKVKILDDKENKLPEETFDFYDHGELRKIANVKTYLTDVVGIISNRSSIKLSQVVNRLQQPQTQLKFHITDGRSHVNVTFWDGMAKKLYEELQKPLDEPVIVIFASAKIGLWKEEVDLSHVAATHFFLNHKHHSVKTIRKRLQDPNFAQQVTGGKTKVNQKLLNIADIKQMQPQTMELEVFTHVTIKYVDDKGAWFIRICTNCKKEVVHETGDFICKTCKRIIPHPEKRFLISIVAADTTGGIELILKDRQVRTLIGKKAQAIYEQQKIVSSFPQELKNLQTKEITVHFTLSKDNVVAAGSAYTAKSICFGFRRIENSTQSGNQDEMNTNNKSATTTTYQLDGMSQLKVVSESF